MCIEIVRNKVQPRNLAGIRTALLRNSTASLLGIPTCSAMIPVRKTSSKWRNGCSVNGKVLHELAIDLVSVHLGCRILIVDLGKEDFWQKAIHLGKKLFRRLTLRKVWELAENQDLCNIRFLIFESIIYEII